MYLAVCIHLDETLHRWATDYSKKCAHALQTSYPAEEKNLTAVLQEVHRKAEQFQNDWGLLRDARQTIVRLLFLRIKGLALNLISHEEDSKEVYHSYYLCHKQQCHLKKAVLKYLSLELNASREENGGQKVALCKYMHAFISWLSLVQ